MVIGWRNLHHVHADKIHVLETADHRCCLMVAQATRDWCSRSRGRGWIKAIDIESQIGFRYQGIRVTPNVYTTVDEVDVFIEAMTKLAKS